eukprot:25614-Eustigmatos_ZCMA.PRE.1
MEIAMREYALEYMYHTVVFDIRLGPEGHISEPLRWAQAGARLGSWISAKPLSMGLLELSKHLLQHVRVLCAIDDMSAYSTDKRL